MGRARKPIERLDLPRRRRPVDPLKLEGVRRRFDQDGLSMAQWARENGFAPKLVYSVLAGDRRCFRGKSYEIAVLLGIKEPDGAAAKGCCL